MSRNPLSTDPHESVTKVGDSLALTSTLGELSQHEKQPIVIQPPTVEDAIRAVRPPLLLCGGSQRLILIVGSEEEKSHYEASVRQAHDGELTVAVIPDSIPTLIHEAQQIKIDDILERLSSLTTGQDEICRRLHSRCDIDW